MSPDPLAPPPPDRSDRVKGRSKVNVLRHTNVRLNAASLILMGNTDGRPECLQHPDRPDRLPELARSRLMAKSKPSPEERLSLTTNPTDPKMTALQTLAALAYFGFSADLIEEDRIFINFDMDEISEDCYSVFSEQVKANAEEIRAALVFARKWQSEWRWLELATMPYQEYLNSDEWKRRREWVIEDAGGRCQVCNSDEQLHVHHRTYERRGCEAPGDLIALCAECHKLFHDHGRLR